MEGMPRLPMLVPDFKFSTASLPAEFSIKLKEYILMHYQDDPSKYEAAINEMIQLRTQFGRLIPDTETVCQMKRYYAQLTMMKSRFPMEEGDPIKIPFAWLDKSMDMPNSTTFEDVNFELTCIMFNIGAIHAAIAANETRHDLDSIKNAFTHFQCAAFPFQHIRDKMNAAKYSSIDFENSLLTWYVNLLLAQAQECILEKSLIDHRKNTVVAKIAIFLRDIYRTCREHLESSGLGDVISSSKYAEWLRTCDVKSELYGAIAMLQLGEQADVDKKMGERLAYYRIAAEHMKAATKYVEKDKRETLRQAIVFANDVVLAKETNAQKENDFIYHDRIPKRDELTMVEGVAMVKPIGFEATDRSVSGDDLFAALLPMNVLKSVSLYSEEKAKLKRNVLERVADKDKELNDYILSLQLDEINIDQSVDELKLPEMLLERSAAFNAQPDAFPDLLDKLQRVGHCAIEADHKLDDLHNRLEAIRSSDLRNDSGFKAIKKELDRISDHHNKARTNNTQLQRAIAAHSENLRVLAMPLSELNRHISGPVVKPSETAEGAQLKRMLDKADEMRKQRVQLVEALNKDLEADDITTKCLAEKDLDNTELYKKELQKHDEAIRIIDMNLTAQTKILAALTEANASFAQCRRQLMELNQRRADQVLALTAAYDVFMDVSHKADEGLKFYSTLFSLVRTLAEAVEGIESAYEEEEKAKEKERHELEQRARELRMAREAREARDSMDQFTTTVQPTRPPSSAANIHGYELGGFPPDAAPPVGGGGGRLKDYLAYYRSKIATPQLPPLPPSSQQQQQYSLGGIAPSVTAPSSYAQAYQPNIVRTTSSMLPPYNAPSLPGNLPPPSSSATATILPAAGQLYQPHSHIPSALPTQTVGAGYPVGMPPSSSMVGHIPPPQQPPPSPLTTGVVPVPSPTIAPTAISNTVTSNGYAMAQQMMSNAASSAPMQFGISSPNPLSTIAGAQQNQTNIQPNAATPYQPSPLIATQTPPQLNGGVGTAQSQLLSTNTQLPSVNTYAFQQGYLPSALQSQQFQPPPKHLTNTSNAFTAPAAITVPFSQQPFSTSNTNRTVASFGTSNTYTTNTTLNSGFGIQFMHPSGPPASTGNNPPPQHPIASASSARQQQQQQPQSMISSNSASAFVPIQQPSAVNSTQDKAVSIPQRGASANGGGQYTKSAINAANANASGISATPNLTPRFSSSSMPPPPSLQQQTQVSPWHQSLLTNPESLMYSNEKLLSNTAAAMQASTPLPTSSSSSLASSHHQTAITSSSVGNVATVPSKPQQNFDLMSSPLNANLPTPLLPSTQPVQSQQQQQQQQQHQQQQQQHSMLNQSTNPQTSTASPSHGRFAQNSAQQVVTNGMNDTQTIQEQGKVITETTLTHAPNTEVVTKKPITMQQNPSAANVLDSACSDHVTLAVNVASVQASPRPAATVAPIVQATSNTNGTIYNNNKSNNNINNNNNSHSLTSDVILGMTSVTSHNYSSTTSSFPIAAQKPLQLTTTIAAASNTAQISSPDHKTINSSDGNRLSNILNPETFTIGEADPTRLEKRQLRTKFRAEGVAAQLPPLNPTDPLNCLDAHYWVKE